MDTVADKRIRRRARHTRIRRRIKGTSDKPRLCVFRSLNHIYGQLVDDTYGKTLIAVSSLNPDLKAASGGTKTQRAQQVGQKLAQQALEKGITQAVFDRAGYQYHGRVKALADAARESGLKF